MKRLPNETLENAIGVYKTAVEACQNHNIDEEDYNPILDKVTIKFLEELQAYRAIGNVEDLKAMKANGSFTGIELANIAVNLQKLKSYIEAEEQGKLVQIECKCQDCVYWSDTVAGATEHVKLCIIGGYMVEKNGYCTYGEKKLEGEDHV